MTQVVALVVTGQPNKKKNFEVVKETKKKKKREGPVGGQKPVEKDPEERKVKERGVVGAWFAVGWRRGSGWTGKGGVKGHIFSS